MESGCKVAHYMDHVATICKITTIKYIAPNSLKTSLINLSIVNQVFFAIKSNASY